jgi:uncharacterized protein (DUF433 family)
MEQTATTQPTVIRTERGLTIAGTRITLYDVMDYLLAEWPPRLIRDRLDLSDQQIADVMEYIQNHRVAVEAEYQHVLQTAEENRRYWEERNQERFARLAALPPRPEQAALRARLNAWKARIEHTNDDSC